MDYNLVSELLREKEWFLKSLDKKNRLHAFSLFLDLCCMAYSSSLSFSRQLEKNSCWVANSLLIVLITTRMLSRCKITLETILRDDF